MNEISMRSFQGTGREWNALVAGFPQAHLLQTWEWAQVKADFGWEPMPLVWGRGGKPDGEQDAGSPVAAAMVLGRQILSKGFVRRLCILYAPKGPLLDWEDEPTREKVLDDLQLLARRQQAVFLKIDPDIEVGRGFPAQEHASEQGKPVLRELRGRGWRISDDQVQFRNTVTVDLSPSEAEMLDRMKQKTRYNVRLATKKGVAVRAGSAADIPMLYKMYAETSDRDGFVIRRPEYYRKVWETFLHRPLDQEQEQPFAEALIAEVNSETVAAVLVFYYAGRAYYLYGMSREAHREKMPNYLLQWEAMRHAKLRGCTVYDLWGAPDTFDETDPMWGVYRFKEGLGGEVVRTLGAWDFPASALWYPVYTRLVPRLLDIMRARGRREVRQTLGGA